MTTRRNNPSDPALLDRPLTARSVVLSLLLGRHPPRAPVALLVRWCAMFGISTTATRVALSRMVERGELTAIDATYELAGRVRARQAEQDVAFAAPLTAWGGEWRLALVTSSARPVTDRAALRAAMGRLRLAELREGVWGRPDNLDRSAEPADALAVADAQCEWWHGARPADPAALADRAFGAAAWGTRGDQLAAALRDAVDGLDVATLAHAFVVGAAVAQHLRRDPLLPDALLPPGWPGPALRRDYAVYVERFGAVLGAWADASS